MTHLAELLAEPNRAFDRIKTRGIDPLALRRAASALAGSEASRHVEQTAELQARIAAATAQNELGDLSRRDLREACAVFLHPPAPPGRDQAIGPALVNQVARLRRRAAFFSLINAYLDAFAVGDPDVQRLGRSIGDLSPSWPWRPGDAWLQRAREYSLFDATRVPERIAIAVLREDAPVRSVLAGAGLDTDVRRRGGLAEASFREACAAIEKLRGTAATAPQLRLIEWSEIGQNSIAFPVSWPRFAPALFVPWGTTEPPADHKRVLLDSAVEYAGDPRIRQATWRNVPADSVDIVLRWLTKASVEQFFDIVSQTMTDRPDMWAARRQFWTRYLRANLISAAWVVFGSDGARRADHAARNQADSGLSLFGRLGSGGGRTAEHAALIMKIGDLTVVEWSHNGSWNVWRRSDRNHPTLFRHNDRHRPDYQPSELMHGPLRGAHQSSWQWRVAEIIRSETGLRP
jgi:hypothetical protein